MRPIAIEPDAPLIEMGMDSLMAVELMTAVKTDFSLDVPAVKLLQGATVDQLTTRVLEQDHRGADRRRLRRR